MKHPVYFPNLNGLRFIAAMLVIIHHIESMKVIFKWNLEFNNSTIFIFGKLGVILFFVLSGFLITYLLLNEENNNNTLSIKQFYLRRIFRIWPLYFLIIILSLFILPLLQPLNFRTSNYHLFYDSFWIKILFFVFFLPNLVLARYGIMPYASQSWSIGVEEQFYIIWPWLIKLFKNRIAMVISVFISYHLINSSLYFFEKDIPYGTLIKYFFEFFNIDCMAIGAFFGIILFQKNEKFLQFICHPFLFYPILLISIILLLFGYSFPLFNYQIYALLFGICIINLASLKATFLEHPVFNYLGKISYGLYMYHVLAIGISIVLLEKMNTSNNALLYLFSILLTIIFSGISYKYFESYFLKLKTKFSANN